MTRSAVDMLSGCKTFLSLAEHSKRLSENLGYTKDLIGETLRLAIGNGLLLPRTKFLDCLAANQKCGDDGDKLSILALPTNSRHSMLGNAILSYSARLSAVGRKMRIVICDDNREARDARISEDLIKDLRHRFKLDFWFSGLVERKKYCELLFKAGCCPLETLEFALLGDRDVGITAGANRNAVLLATLGHTVLSVDDDTKCHTLAIPESEEGKLEIRDNPLLTSWYYSDRKAAFCAAESINLDPFSSHDAFLGKRISNLLSSAKPDSISLYDSTKIAADLMHPKARIVLTFNGVVGDCGTYSTGWALDGSGPSRARLLASEADYQVAARSRDVIRGVAATTICQKGPIIGTWIGLDNRHLLPPFLPVLRNEDGVFGSVLRGCEPWAFSAHLPFAMIHDPEQFREYAVPRSTAPTVFRFPDFLCQIVRRICSEELTPKHTMRSIGWRLQEMGDQHVADFRKTATQARIRHLSTSYRALKVMMDGSEAPVFWKRDAEATLACIEQIATSEESLLFPDLATTDGQKEPVEIARTLVKRFGRLLNHWPDIIAAAKEMNARGKSIARLVH